MPRYKYFLKSKIINLPSLKLPTSTLRSGSGFAAVAEDGSFALPPSLMLPTSLKLRRTSRRTGRRNGVSGHQEIRTSVSRTSGKQVIRVVLRRRVGDG